MALIALALQWACSENAQLDEVSSSHYSAIYRLFLPQCSGQQILLYAIYCQDICPTVTEKTVSFRVMQPQRVCEMTSKNKGLKESLVKLLNGL